MCICKYIYTFFCSRDIHVSTIHRRSLYMHLTGIVFNYGHVEQGNTPIEVAMFATIGYILPEYWRCDVSESGWRGDIFWIKKGYLKQNSLGSTKVQVSFGLAKIQVLRIADRFLWRLLRTTSQSILGSCMIQFRCIWYSQFKHSLR